MRLSKEKLYIFRGQVHLNSIRGSDPRICGEDIHLALPRAWNLMELLIPNYAPRLALLELAIL